MASPGPQRSPSQPQGRSSGGMAPAKSETVPIPFTPKWTADEYIQAITDHSQQASKHTMYPADIFEIPEHYLKRGSVAPEAGNHAPDGFAWLVSPGQQAPSTSGSQKNQGQSEGFSDVQSCIDALRNNIEASRLQVLFLRGHPPPNWLSSIGAFCNVDPELFRWFTRYQAYPENDCYFGHPPLAMSRIFRFTFFTIVEMNPDGVPEQVIHTRRIAAAHKVRRYQAGRSRDIPSLKPGDSIVRNFYVLDSPHCVIEQEMAILTFEIGKTWMAIACTDAGEDLTVLTKGPPILWRGGRERLTPELTPIIQYQPQCAPKSSVIPKTKGNTQSLAVFPEGYGRRLDWASAASDRFPVFSEVFRLSAFSRKQLLNLLQRKILDMAETLESDYKLPMPRGVVFLDNTPTLANLHYYRNILQDQVTDISQMLLLTSGESRLFHKGATRLPVTAHNAVDMDDLHNLLQDLHSQAQSLVERCSQGMMRISHNRMLEESQRAIQQTKQVTKLTLVAFVCLPFTFTAGFFGMNLKELEASKISLWVYFVISIPLTIISLLLFILDASSIGRIYARVSRAMLSSKFYYWRLRRAFFARR